MFEIEVVQQKGLITWNYEALKRELSERLERYRGLIVTEDAIKEFKDTKANLNKVSKAIDDERKRIKKLYCEPLEVFENEAKVLVSMVNEVSKAIDDQIKSFDEQEKQDKKEAIELFFDDLRFFLVPLTKIFDERWLNKSVSEKQWKESLSSRVENIKVELAIINNFVGTDEDRETIKAFYLETLSLNTATAKHEMQQQAKERLKLAELARQTPPVHETVQEVQTPREVVIDVTVNATLVVEEELLLRKMWIRATRENIIKISEFMNSLDGVTYGKLEG